MSDSQTEPAILEAKYGSIETEVMISASAPVVWAALVENINQWWLPDFRALGSDSSVSLDLRFGGGLTESLEQDSMLEWYKVQMFQTNESLYLVGDVAPDWGGPTTSMLKLHLKETESGCLLSISDSLLGKVNAAKLQNVKEGWELLFGSGLKIYIESNQG